MEKEIVFRLMDTVEVTMWEGITRKNWVIIGFASDGSEAHLSQYPTGIQTIVKISKLKHQEKIEVL